MYINICTPLFFFLLHTYIMYSTVYILLYCSDIIFYMLRATQPPSEGCFSDVIPPSEGCLSDVRGPFRIPNPPKYQKNLSTEIVHTSVSFFCFLKMFENMFNNSFNLYSHIQSNTQIPNPIFKITVYCIE